MLALNLQLLELVRIDHRLTASLHSRGVQLWLSKPLGGVPIVAEAVERTPPIRVRAVS
jgi:hypothetical protein